MPEALVKLLGDVRFWALAGGGWLLWWLLAVAIARLSHGVSHRPLRAARSAGWWALVLAPAAGGGFAWYESHDPLQVVALAVAVLVLPLVLFVVLARHEPQVNDE
jgi:uncharacterized membrane protein YhaH (DUF805 family)